MINQSALLDVYEDFAAALLHAYDIGEMLYRLTDQVVEVLDVDGAGVALARDGQALAYVTASDERVAAIEEFQADSESGPCHAAFSANEQVRVDDVRVSDRWPAYGEVAASRGLLAVASLPMPVGERRIGAMDLYRETAGPWSDEVVRVAQVLANMASGYVLNNLELSESRTLAQQLQTALDSRVVIEQAKGVVAERRHVSPNDAFARLRDHARNSNQKLHEVCQQVVDRELLL
ncbi:MAG TPA: GAF and ANTAR domain-containing protein [Nitriliruptoraceae bacterium]|nr:GAF and ANTAR domain-containing protein [Nitriliruptoraceae bacterium]